MLYIIFNMHGCSFPTNEWIELESDYDHVLNVFGLVNLDSGYPSYIGLYRTTNLDEKSQNLVEIDTLYYCDCSNDECWDCDEVGDGYWVIDSIYEPAALIKDASVSLSDDEGNVYIFSFVDKITFVDTIYFDTTFVTYGTTVSWDTTIYDTNNYRINYYVDTTGLFIPEPGVKYNLSITAPGFNDVVGSLVTPVLPNLDSLSQKGVSVDTVVVNEPFTIHWREENEGTAMITGEVIDRYYSNSDSTSDDWWCGGYFDPFIIDLGNSSQNPYSVQSEFCDQTFEEPTSKDYYIRLISMDDNYYEYFITGEQGEYSNAILNYPTTKGRSVGINGGFGFFGSIASDGLLLKISNR